MLRPSLVACSECACHVRATEPECPHCGAELAALATTDVRKVKRAAVAISLGLAVSVAHLAACDDTSGTGGAGGATNSSTASSGSKSSSGSMSGSTTGSDTSSIAAYGVAGTSTGVGTASSSGSGN